MELTIREWWGLVHGILLGALFLLAFAGGLAELHALNPKAETSAGMRLALRRIGIGITSMAVLAWLTAITGTWIVYPWYRAEAPGSAKSLLLSDEATDAWHTFGMEWKEHIAWISPILATAVAFIVLTYGRSLATSSRLHRVAVVLFVTAFVLAAVAGLLGALITKAAPVR